MSPLNDTAQSTNPVKMTGLKMIVGASQIVFGSDHIDPAATGIESISRVCKSATLLPTN